MKGREAFGCGLSTFCASVSGDFAMKSEQYLTKRELAEFYGISTRTVSNLMKLGLPVIYLGLRLVRFPRDLVEDFFDEFRR